MALFLKLDPSENRTRILNLHQVVDIEIDHDTPEVKLSFAGPQLIGQGTGDLATDAYRVRLFGVEAADVIPILQRLPFFPSINGRGQ